MMNHEARRDRAVSVLVDDVSAQTPHVRLGHLHESALVLSARALSDSLDAHRHPIVWAFTSLELRCGRSTSALWWGLEVAGSLGCARIGAVVDRSALGGFAVECDSAGRAGEWRQLRRMAVHRRAVGLSTLSRAEDQARRVALQSVGLNRELGSTVGAGCKGHAVQYSGSGTTLAVATGHGHDALGVDLDSRNADLARERIGPLLFEEVTLDTLRT